MKKEATKKAKTNDDCGGLKPYNPIKAPAKKTTGKQGKAGKK